MSINWTELLKPPVIPNPCINQRPFVCDGFPDESEVIVIGTNPRNDLGVNWWDFWDNSSGFDYCRFSDVYQEKGGNLKTGTRGRFTRIRCQHRIKCVETNVYNSEGSCKGKKAISNQEILKILLRNMLNLKAVIAHGIPARDWTDVNQNLICVPCHRVDHFGTPVQFKEKKQKNRCRH